MEFSSIALPTTYMIPPLSVYGIFFYCPSDHIHDSPFVANLASLPGLPINTSYASSTSVNISGYKPTLILIYIYINFCLIFRTRLTPAVTKGEINL